MTLPFFNQSLSPLTLILTTEPGLIDGKSFVFLLRRCFALFEKSVGGGCCIKDGNVVRGLRLNKKRMAGDTPSEPGIVLRIIFSCISCFFESTFDGLDRSFDKTIGLCRVRARSGMFKIPFL